MSARFNRAISSASEVDGIATHGKLFVKLLLS